MKFSEIPQLTPPGSYEVHVSLDYLEEHIFLFLPIWTWKRSAMPEDLGRLEIVEASVAQEGLCTPRYGTSGLGLDSRGIRGRRLNWGLTGGF